MITVVPDISLVYQMINFLILLFVLNQVLFKPIRKVLLDRQSKIQSLEEGVTGAVSELRSREDSYREGLKKARGEGLKNKQACVEEAGRQEREILEQINRKAQANLAQIRQQVATEAEQARKALEKEIDFFARAIGEKILGRAFK